MRGISKKVDNVDKFKLGEQERNRKSGESSEAAVKVQRRERGEMGKDMEEK